MQLEVYCEHINKDGECTRNRKVHSASINLERVVSFILLRLRATPAKRT